MKKSGKLLLTACAPSIVPPSLLKSRLSAITTRWSLCPYSASVGAIIFAFVKSYDEENLKIEAEAAKAAELAE